MTDGARRGAIGVVPVAGTGGFLIALGELINDRRDGAQHAFVLLDDADDPNARVLEAESNGARISPLSHCARPIAWIDPPFKDSTRDLIVANALKLEGTPYSWWTYLWIAACRLNIRSKWLRERVNRWKDGKPTDAMCSQLADCDWVMTKAQLPADDPDVALLTIFDDGRLPQNVTPGDLAWIAATKPWETATA